MCCVRSVREVLILYDDYNNNNEVLIAVQLLFQWKLVNAQCFNEVSMYEGLKQVTSNKYFILVYGITILYIL